MDKDTLVEDQIVDGWKLLILMAQKGLDLTIAGWAKIGDEERWYLYIASKLVDEKGPVAAYRDVYGLLNSMECASVSMSDVKLISPANRIAVDLLDVQNRYSAKMPIRIKRHFGSTIAFDEVYIYPTGPGFIGSEQQWFGIPVLVFQDERESAGYRVEFWSHALHAALKAGSGARRVPRPATVRVVNGRVIEFSPSEEPFPMLTQSDYEKRALKAVEEVAAVGN